MNIFATESDLFKALAEPIRLRILVLLSDGELCVCDLTALLELPQPTISRHMGKLKQLGLVTDRRNGRWVHYRLADATDPVVGQLLVLVKSLGQRQPYAHDLEKLKKHECAGNCK
jgi:ArsR family transcriptional regulator